MALLFLIAAFGDELGVASAGQGEGADFSQG